MRIKKKISLYLILILTILYYHYTITSFLAKKLNDVEYFFFKNDFVLSNNKTLPTSNNNQIELIENEYFNYVEKLFEPDSNLNQLKHYLTYKKSFNKNDSEIFLKTKKYLNKMKNKKKKPYYLIVEYTEVFANKKFCQLNLNEQMLGLIKSKNIKTNLLNERNVTLNSSFSSLDKCYYKNCFFTCDKSLSSIADSILFHYYDFIALIKNNKEKNIINFKRDSSQTWVLWNDEAIMIDPEIDSYKMNWTISFNSKSEISYATYGVIASLNRELTDSELNAKIEHEFKKRKNKAAWFVSNCNTKSRLRFSANLGQHFSIEIYGKCSKQIKEYQKDLKYLNLNEINCDRDSECEHKLLKTNKFYLAFESQNCSDYITEKFWRSLSYDLIPIVLYPNKEYYERVAPTHSFIHASDFNYDVFKLSNYLNKISNDIEMYEKFFQWKRKNKVIYNGEYLEQLKMCEFCEKLNNQKNFYYSYYENFSNWFNKQCTREWDFVAF